MLLLFDLLPDELTEEPDEESPEGWSPPTEVEGCDNPALCVVAAACTKGLAESLLVPAGKSKAKVPCTSCCCKSADTRAEFNALPRLIDHIQLLLPFVGLIDPPSQVIQESQRMFAVMIPMGDIPVPSRRVTLAAPLTPG